MRQAWDRTDMTSTQALGAHLLVTDGVHIVRWPEQEAWRRTLAAARVPRILLVESSALPPEEWDELEDWIRLPLDPHDLQARARAVGLRAQGMSRPVVDEQGIAWVDDLWVELSPPQAAVAAVLVENFGEVVAIADIAVIIEGAGASVAVSARKALITRLRRRLATVGLMLHNVRDRGYLLDRGDRSPATLPSDGCTES